MGKFKVKKITNLNEVTDDTEFPESDYACLTSNGKFVQLEYLEERKTEQTIVKAGIWGIKVKNYKCMLEETSFVQDKILKSFLITDKVIHTCDQFFKKLDIYAKYGIEIPKRGILLWGPQGSGKSSSLIHVAEKYAADGRTAVLLWRTDKYDANTVKDFIRSFQYEGVDKMILIAEDIGGVEMNQVRIKSEPALLSLLDNQEKTFSIPILIIGTTNHPEVFMGNLTNRPGRFDDKIEVTFPNAKQRDLLLKFFLKDVVNADMSALIQSNKCATFTPAHIKDIGLRMDLFDKSGVEAINDIVKQIEMFDNDFEKKKTMGMGFHTADDDDE